MPVDAGTYWGTPTGGQGVAESSTQKPFIYITFLITHRVVGGDYVEVPSPFERDVRIYVSDDAMDYSKPSLEALGFNGKFDEKMEFANLPVEGAQLLCEHRPFNNRTMEQWSIAGLGGPVRTPLASDKARQLEARWKARTTPARRPPGRPATPAKQAAPGGEAPQPDIPF